MTEKHGQHNGKPIGGSGGRRQRVKNLIDRLPNWLMSVMMTLFILWLTLAPHPVGDNEIELFAGADKLIHGLMFGLLTGFCLLDWSRAGAWRSATWFGAMLTAAGCALFGIGIEFLQRAMGLGRSLETADMVADGIGCFLFAAMWMVLQSGRPGETSEASEAETGQNAEDSTSETATEENPEEKNKRRHRMSAWIRIPLKVVMWIVIVVLTVPILVYIPPVQTLLKNVACDVVKDKTGMDVKIDLFRLKFPLDVSLDGVSAVQSNGDTLMSARQVIADVKLLPLFDLDVQIKRLQLRQGYYNMVSADSSMIMKIRAGLLDVDSRSSANISQSKILLNKATLKDGDISLYMNVWKKKPTPPDSVQPTTPFLIQANDLQLENITFAMSMLPTIDTLRVSGRDLNLKNAVIDLGTNNITADRLSLAHGTFKYLAPTPEYVRTHPAPVDTITPPSAPMVIKAKEIALNDFSGLYGIKGARPMPGFDANYVEVSDVDLSMKDFYNESATVILPITSLRAKERCGLQITEGSGTFSLDSLGMRLTDLRVRTPYSRADVTADIPFALMELKPEAAVDVKGNVSIGIPDVVAFMPTLQTYTKYLGKQNPLNAILSTHGTLSSVIIDRLDASMAGLFSLRAKGYARNPLNIKKLDALVSLEGEVKNPSPIEKIAGPLGFELPPFKLSGTATAKAQTYTADMKLLSPAGDLAAKGNVSLTAETYLADVDVRGLNVGRFVPELGVGSVTATLHAKGAGFNPATPGAATYVDLQAIHVDYNKIPFENINLEASLSDGAYTLYAHSPNEYARFLIDIEGTVAPDLYTASGRMHVDNLDLQAIGLSKDVNNGSLDLTIDGEASPDRWLYNATLDIASLQWDLPGQYIHLPEGIHACINAQANNVECEVEAQRTSLKFESETGLKRLIDSMMAASAEVTEQIKKRELITDAIQRKLPPFRLQMAASGKGLASQFLTSAGMSIDTVYATLVNDSLLRGDIGVINLNTGSLELDTITLNLNQRGSLLDYKAHLGNRPGTLDEFNKVDLNGYLGSNRMSAYLRQWNLQGEMGYRIGLTAALSNEDKVSVHFTPLKATIAYLPWTLNDDNYIDLDLHTKELEANLYGKSKESSILIKTEDNPEGGNDLHLNLSNIHIQDFLQMSITAPPLSATVDSDIRLHYTGKILEGNGTLDISNFIYDKTYVGNIGLNLKAGMDPTGDSGVQVGMDVDGSKDAMVLRALLTNSTEAGLEPKDISLVLNQLPMRVANAFLGATVAKLDGTLNGEMDLTGGFTKPILNGNLHFDKGKVFIPYIGSTLTLDSVPVTVANNVVDFDRFDVWGANRNPLTLDGTVDATDFSNIALGLTLTGSNVQLINNDKRAKSELYGKLFVDMNTSVKGPLSHFDIRANLGILGTSDVYYTIPTSTAMALEENDQDVVQFVNLSDTTAVATADSIPRMMNMRINAALNINPGTQATVFLSSNGTDKVQVTPSGTLNFFMNYMGDMRLTGQIYTGTGFARYSIPVIGEKMFEFNPQSNILWNGDVMNPTLSVEATDDVKANVVQSGGNTNLVNFLVTLKATGTLSQPNLLFDLSTEDDMTIQNQLQAMSADQRQQQAMNLLLTGQYSGGGFKTDSGPIVGSAYSFLTSQLNSWLAKNVRGIDLSFGVDQYDRTRDGQSSTTTSYSYQLSKSLFNNRFKINVGGNYSTDASADENLEQNLISDVSFEYMLKQTQTMTMLVKLFRHNDYESILEGEVSEMGAGFVYKRRLQSMRGLFRFGSKKKTKDNPSEADTGEGGRRVATKEKETGINDGDTTGRAATQKGADE
ncbi:MAG: translocation/assembly module TamB domain-containing protein [Muribaculum sp.]|nr:translocation/assembly module TamB domain-containing protein [Muribaculum sp.]